MNNAAATFGGNPVEINISKGLLKCVKGSSKKSLNVFKKETDTRQLFYCSITFEGI